MMVLSGQQQVSTFKPLFGGICMDIISIYEVIAENVLDSVCFICSFLEKISSHAFA
jgi:hypothetical protein